MLELSAESVSEHGEGQQERRPDGEEQPAEEPLHHPGADPPIAATGDSRGAWSSGKPMRKTGTSIAAPLMPVNIAMAATVMHTGSMNQ